MDCFIADVGGHEACVELRLPDLLDLELDLALGQRADLLSKQFDVGPALADNDARLGGVDRDRDVVDATLDLDATDTRVGQPLDDKQADRDVFL